MYTQEGIEEFQNYIEKDNISPMIMANKMVAFTCLQENKIVGFLALRPVHHISLLFVDKQFHRRGIAKALFEKAKKYVQTHTAQQIITVNSSPYAQPVYERLGFTAQGDEKTVNGITFIPMELKL